MTGFGGGEDHPGYALERVRAELAGPLRDALAAPEAQVRGAAALAYGRIDRGPSVERILPLLRDPSNDVRERALFALGASGSQHAAEVLLRIARTGAHEEEGGVPATHDARALAVFALAVGRRNGLPETVDNALAELTRDASQPGEELLATSLLLYQTLAPTAELSDWALALAADERALPSVRCRALETLRLRHDEAALFTLLDALDDPQVDLRRSAALALGELDHPLESAWRGRRTRSCAPRSLRRSVTSVRRTASASSSGPCAKRATRGCALRPPTRSGCTDRAPPWTH